MYVFKWLGRKYGIEVEEREETIDEKQHRLKREPLLIVNATVHQHYREVFLRYKPAQDYAYHRWGQKYCDEIEIGFAPIDGKALAHLPLQKEFLQELGLTNKQGYDFFQNRIVIPIKDRFQHIIGFTARVMDDGQPKYLNSKESLLYSKRSTVFGLDVAWRAAGKTGQMYLVEGAPDCMRLHSIGVQNIVADLGSAWTAEQFQLIKRAANKVCFIPDTYHHISIFKEVWEENSDLRIPSHKWCRMGFRPQNSILQAYGMGFRPWNSILQVVRNEIPTSDFHFAGGAE